MRPLCYIRLKNNNLRMSLPSLSVIIPIYNVEKYIEKCARSLFEQSLIDIEYIFVDDCTPDNSIRKLMNVLDCYPNRKEQVRIIRHSINQGLTSARNTGLQSATGKYIAHCDSDDWVELDMYENLLRTAEDTNSDIVYCDIMMHFAGGTKEVYESARYSGDKIQLMKNYISSVWTSVVNMIVRKDLYNRYSLESPRHISYCEDYWLSVRLFHYADKISKVSMPFYNYNRTNETSILHRLNQKSETEERIANLETINFFASEGYLDRYERELSWRLLKSTHDSIYYPGRYDEFLTIYPQAHKYIWSCPFVNKKSKLFMWMLSHNMQRIALGILKIRYIIKNRKDVI